MVAASYMHLPPAVPLDEEERQSQDLLDDLVSLIITSGVESSQTESEVGEVYLGGCYTSSVTSYWHFGSTGFPDVSQQCT